MKNIENLASITIATVVIMDILTRFADVICSCKTKLCFFYSTVNIDFRNQVNVKREKTLNEIIIEIFRTVVVPILIALSTIYASYKISEKTKDKHEKAEASKQMELFYLRIIRLITSLMEYKKLMQDLKELKEEYNALKDGYINYFPEEHEGMSKQEYMSGIFGMYEDWKNISAVKKSKDIYENYKALKTCSIDKIPSKERFDCLRVIEMDYNRDSLLKDLAFLEDLSKRLKPKYK